MAAGSALVELRGVSKTYPGAGKPALVIEDLSIGMA